MTQSVGIINRMKLNWSGKVFLLFFFNVWYFTILGVFLVKCFNPLIELLGLVVVVTCAVSSTQVS